MILAMMGFYRFLRYWYHIQKVWYHIWYHSFSMISYSFWQYHIHFSLSCAIFSWYCLWYHIHIIQYLLWYQYIMILRMTSEHISHDKVLWYQYIMISKPCDITDFMICSPISCHLRGGMGRVGGASFQPLHLLRPRHRPRAGDGCPAERRRTWSRAWTCCGWASDESAGSGCSSCLCNLKLHRVKFKLKHHTGSGPGDRVLLEQPKLAT